MRNSIHRARLFKDVSVLMRNSSIQWDYDDFDTYLDGFISVVSAEVDACAWRGGGGNWFRIRKK